VRPRSHATARQQRVWLSASASGSRVDTRWYRDTELARTSASSMAAKLTPMQLRAATQRRNSYITAGVAFSMVGGVYYYTMQAMSGTLQTTRILCASSHVSRQSPTSCSQLPCSPSHWQDSAP
jgi:hypothetical protein